jgi:hypothetical protein
MVQPCGPCRMLVWKRAWQERPHAGLTAITEGLTTWRSGGGRRTQFRCGACGAMLVRSRLTRLGIVRDQRLYLSGCWVGSCSSTRRENRHG